MYWFFLVPILAYYIIYPGGKKNWLKRKKEIDLHFENKDQLQNELHDLDE